MRRFVSVRGVWGLAAVIAVVGALTLVPAIPGTVTRTMPVSANGPVTVSFSIRPRVSAEVLDDGILVLANTPWTATVFWRDRDGVIRATTVAGTATGAHGDYVRGNGKLAGFTLVAGR